MPSPPLPLLHLSAAGTLCWEAAQAQGTQRRPPCSLGSLLLSLAAMATAVAGAPDPVSPRPDQRGASSGGGQRIRRPPSHRQRRRRSGRSTRRRFGRSSTECAPTMWTPPTREPKRSFSNCRRLYPFLEMQRALVGEAADNLQEYFRTMYKEVWFG
ncbi:uncharacterized protein [Miscanthus floridulus]|uniref:uncharacterized protein n=1 Tax=Miscanthus floridulus TaxID=154761 RepID=UPI00345ADD30